MSQENCGCQEFEDIRRGMTRRNFISSVLALGGGLLITDPSGLQYAAAATPGSKADVIIGISMRGGMDGLMAVQPLGSSALKAFRPNISMNDSVTLPLDGTFGLHPNLIHFKKLFDTKQLAIIHATGTPVGTRSHFDDQKSLELAAYDNPSLTQGWQNRFLQANGATDVFAGFAPQSQTPISMLGDAGVAVFNNINNVVLDNVSDIKRSDYLEVLRRLHSSSDHLWQRTALHSLDASEKLQSIDQSTPVTYPNTGFGARMRVLAQLLKSNVPIQTANVDFDGNVYVHSAAGILDGTIANNFKSLNDAIAAFQLDVGDLWNRITIVTLTEFGRRLEENASQGIDHGWASVTFAMGGGIKGGQVITKWPGLVDLRDGDLRVTTDYRQVLLEVLRNRGGLSAVQLANVLPNFGAPDLGFTKPLSV
jgi:uncharacterized protein (DUF1501 family)